MDAPDKIYLPVIASPLLHRDVIENHWMEIQSPFAKENIAYIRKDALLEWVEKTKEMRIRLPIEYSNEDYQAGFIDGFDRFRSELLYKLNSL